MSLWCFLVTSEYISFFSSVSIVYFEQVNVNWAQLFSPSHANPLLHFYTFSGDVEMKNWREMG